MLEIQGFKSFADRITIEFVPGITSVVGPNGSGKSNISDAVRWVMGEQSARLLRGNKMEDIIFSGTQKRNPVGFAEVAITFDNYDKALPIEFDEVIVKRRMYRSGESEYYINKSSCRLKDIHELFMDTGIGKDGYSIIGQGRIDEILSTKPDDRRNIFEEAAGITKYRYRKEEAEKKLNLTEQNLIRIKDIVIELETQLKPLKDQSEKAEKYLDLKEKLKYLEINVLLQSIDKAKTLLNEASDNYNIVDEQLKSEERNISISEEKLETLYKELKDIELHTENARNSMRDEENLVNTYKNKTDMYLNDIKNSEANIIRIENDIRVNVSSIDELKNELEKLEEYLNNLNSQKKEVYNELNLMGEKKDALEELIVNVNNIIGTIKSEIFDNVNNISAIKSKVDSLNVINNSFSERKASIQEELDKNKQEQKDLEEYNFNMNKKREDFSVSYDNIDKELRKTKENLANAEKESININKEYDKALNTIKEKEARKSFLEEMEKTYEGYSRSVKSILKEVEKGSLKNLNVHGTLSQLIKVPDEIVTAIEMALGSSMQNIVVDNEYDAKKAIEFLKEKNLGRATFLPISSVKGRGLSNVERKIENMPGYLGVASDLILCESQYKDIVDSLLGRVVVTEDMNTGIAIARSSGYKFKIVTLKGDILNPGGSLTGGSVNKMPGLLSRASEILKLDSEISSLHLSLNTIKEKHERTEKLIKSHKEIIDRKIAEADTIKTSLITIDAELKNNKKLIDNLIKNITSLEAEETQLKNEMDDIVIQIKDLNIQSAKFHEEISEKEKLVHLKQDAFEKEITEKEEINKQIVEKKLMLNSIEKDINTVTEKKDTVIKDIDKYEQAVNLNQSEKNKLLTQIEQYNSYISDFNDKIDKTNKDIENKRLSIASYIKDKNDKESLVDETQKRLKEKREENLLIRDNHRRLENKKIKLEIELETAINKLWDEYNHTYNSAIEYKREIPSITRAQNQIDDIKANIKELGEVNVNALEEYKNVKNRYEFLTKQGEDLEKAKSGLKRVIEDMIKLMEEQFYAQFKIINKNFNSVFNELFTGGKAELKLSQPDNVLNSGIDIEAQPPGKKLQSIMLLSGGERALTAIALLFAILKMRPTPFCILDEIEATLDDVNVYRFARYLKRYSKKTQFILITHRRGTMEASDVLYGVTMQEKGVSGLISLDMAKIAK
jgi:chromosome segregation protein